MLLQAIAERRSVRTYQSRDLAQEQVLEIIRAAQFAPTGMNNRAVEFIVVRDAAVKNRLFELLEPRQPFIKEAPAILFPVTDTRKTPVATADLALASAFIFLQAASLGLGTVWKHVAPEQVPAVREILGIPADYTLINAIPVGYPQQKPPAHSVEAFDPAKIHFEKW
jgi:nitroreductase